MNNTGPLPRFPLHTPLPTGTTLWPQPPAPLPSPGTHPAGQGHGEDGLEDKVWGAPWVLHPSCCAGLPQVRAALGSLSPRSATHSDVQRIPGEGHPPIRHQGLGGHGATVAARWAPLTRMMQ